MKKNENKNSQNQPNNPLHGVKLAEVIEYLVAEHGWKGLAQMTDIRLFSNKPTEKSCLKLARKTPWVRSKLEDLYLESFKRME